MGVKIFIFTFINEPIRVNKKRNETEILCSDWLIGKSKKFISTLN